MKLSAPRAVRSEFVELVTILYDLSMARSGSPVNSESFLQAALEGLQLQKQRIEEQIAHVRGLLGRGGKEKAPAAVLPSPNKTRRKLSAAARKRIAAAQKKRWAAYRKENPASKAE